MANIYRKGRKKIMSNNGHVQLDVTGNRILQYDGTKFRTVIGDKTSTDSKFEVTKEGSSVLNV